MKYPRKWENIGTGIRRLKVPNGWLVQVFTDNSVDEGTPSSVSTAITFVSDTTHTWELEADNY